MLGIGWYSMSRTSNNAGYIVGGRSLGSAITAISAGASDMSGWPLRRRTGILRVTRFPGDGDELAKAINPAIV